MLNTFNYCAAFLVSVGSMQMSELDKAMPMNWVRAVEKNQVKILKAEVLTPYNDIKTTISNFKHIRAVGDMQVHFAYGAKNQKYVTQFCNLQSACKRYVTFPRTDSG